MKRYGKKLRRLVSACLLAVWMGCLLSASVFAKTEEYSIKLDEEKTNYVFEIQWENTEKQPDVTLTAPSGKTYNLENMPDADAGEGELLFYFPKAEKGEWKVKISGDGLGAVTLDSGVMPGRMNITSFQASVSGDKGTASWKIEDSEEDLTLEIWAAPDPVNYGGERIASLRGKASGNSEFSLSELDSGDYYLYLKAIGSGGIYAYQYDDTRISYRRGDSLPKLSGVQARMMDDDVWLTWDLSEEADSYRVMVWDENGEVLADENVTQTADWYVEIPQDLNTAEAAVAAVRYGRTGDFQRYTVTRGNFDSVTVTFPEGDQLNTKSVQVNVAFTGNYTVSAALNGELLCEDSKEAGNYRVDMEEGDNRVAFYIKDENGNVRTYGKDLHIDATPPQLSILHDLNGRSTSDDHVYLEGHTEGGAVLTLNGETVETQAGYFSILCGLRIGSNTFELVAADGAGNQTRYTATVERPWFSAEALVWILCIAVGVVLLVVYVILFIRGRRKRKA